MGTMNADFSGDVALVTGAAGGMGRAVALAFAEAGASVILCDTDEAGGQETVQLVEATGASALFQPVDVSNGDEVKQLVAAGVSRFGRLDAAVNCAAIEGGVAPLHECEDDLFDRTQAVNTRGIFLSMKSEIEAMLQDKTDGAETGGAIVNIASTNSFRPQHDQPAYTASKHAVIGLTRSAAYDYSARGIRINAICPGTIDTPMLQAAMKRRGRDPQDVIDRLSLVGRFGRPDEIASAALWLCSDASSFTMGHALAVDAGYLAR